MGLQQVSDHSHQGVARVLRDAPPAHYSLKIESFSSLVKLAIERYESAAFDVGGYTWYHSQEVGYLPKQKHKKRRSRAYLSHISLYLAIDKTSSLPLDWQACATYKIFLYDHNKDKYLIIQDDPVHEVRFNAAKKESGFDKLISLDIFKDATSGYLIDDSCIFGVEIHPVKYTGKGETLKMNVVVSQEVAFIWKIPKFSKIIKRTPNGRKLVSEQFAVGKYKWRLWLYPNGNSAGSKDSISLFFELAEKSSTVEKVLARFSIGIQNIMSQTYGQPKAGSGCFSTTQFRWFSTTKSDGDATNWGWNRFMLLSDLQNELNRIFRVKDRTLLLQAKVNIEAEVSNFS
ncbi:hypothetical protein AgCh_033445 [Apium graveolens]